jgi:diguanylate cyclase (GGDEF)-like protein
MNSSSVLHQTSLGPSLFLVVPVALWALFTSLSYSWNTTEVEANTQNLATERGRMVFSVIQATRSWNARHGGVYAPTTDTSPPNPYLKIDEKNIKTPSGRLLTLVNPAYMTRQLEQAMSETKITIHLTSLKPLNPNNKANEWEREALASFEHGTGEVIKIVPSDDGPQYNFMAPLFVKKACLQCHEVQGYKEGDVQGGLRVSFPVTEIKEAERKIIITLQYIHVVAFLLLSSLSVLAITRVQNLIENLKDERNQRDRIIAKQTLELTNEISERRKSQKKFEKLSVIDDLTGIHNRRSINDALKNEVARAERYGELFSIIMVDIDKFKAVNDTYGHNVGDEVLQSFTKHVQGYLRKTDMLARYGGEEFVILLPHANDTATLNLANRIRKGTMEMEASASEKALFITISAGIAQFTPKQSQDMDDLLKRADKALYEAKRSGRNRCVAAA